MGAYNWLLFDCTCPACGKAVNLRVQTHAARSYDGDDRGMFHNRDYRLGEEMRW